MDCKVTIEYLTAGCNNETGIFDESDGFLLYASGKNVLISQIPGENSHFPVTCALPFAAKGRIHSCQWIKLSSGSRGALVASDDGFLRFYTCEGNPLLHSCWSLNSAIDLGSAVTLAAVDSGDPAHVVAVTVKGEIHFVNLAHGSSQLVRSYAPKKITAITIGILPSCSDSHFILAALSDSNIRLLTRDDTGIMWKEELSISGHQNWITSLSVKPEPEAGSVMVLSSSLDKTIRVWRIQEGLHTEKSEQLKLSELVPQKNSFTHNNKSFSVLADSLALGHENAVYFARFFTNPSDGSTEILSGSSDRSLILWARGFGGAWRTILQLGDLNGSLGTIGTDHTFAFYGGIIYRGEWIVASASTGSILFWKRTDSSSEWIPQIPITGHSDRVESLAWSPLNSSKQFLVTTSKDQTTRIFSNNREIARPQIHGYDLKCIAIRSRNLDDFSAFELISGADEKVIRVFSAPKQFYRKLGLPFNEQVVPESAELPALGLSNKTSSDSGINNSNSNESPLPENEGDLVRNSLWPEVDKLYGHNQEICSLALSPNGKFMASSAKSHLAADAALRLWSLDSSNNIDTKWLPTFVVPAHTLTVSSLVFSPDSRLLLSVSRDRNFCLISPETGAVLCRTEAHSRMIFTADWITPDTFVTGSRDKTVKIWKTQEENGNNSMSVTLIHTLNFENGITSLSANPKSSVLAAGDELGNIFIYKFNFDSVPDWTLELTVNGGGGLGPADSITDLKWNPSELSHLAVASADNSIRILRFYL